MKVQNAPLSDETGRRIAEALERIAAAAEAQAQQEPVSFPNAPVLAKDRPRRSVVDPRRAR